MPTRIKTGRVDVVYHSSQAFIIKKFSTAEFKRVDYKYVETPIELSWNEMKVRRTARAMNGMRLLYAA